eukprot:TRINITY_DN1196_c0_g1_i8.p1 TRINITY_DN1196_c0_g1~~TRINITY_DN1196_c0_g1_i8.p1  ORF type:complete len:451 (-),score=244.97 TRINITY_DN1196_c0_g1_i8:271-1623(-)
MQFIVVLAIVVLVESAMAQGVPPPPFGLAAVFTELIPHVAQSETPIQLRITHYMDLAGWMCVAATTPGTKEPFGLSASPITLALSGTTAEQEAKRQLCHLYAVQHLARNIEGIVADAAPVSEAVLATMGETVSGVFSGDVQTCRDTVGKRGPVPERKDGERRQLSARLATCLQPLLSDERALGEAVAALVLEFASGDGWNADGRVSASGGECQAFCRPFADFTGYAPQNSPWTRGDYHQDFLSDQPSGAASVDSDGGDFALRWAPLLEDDGRGFFVRQEHVTPHIGLTAETRALSPSDFAARVAEPPCYDYNKELRLLTHRLAHLNDERKLQVEFFDGKLGLALNIIVAALPEILPRVGDLQYTGFAHFLAGLSASEFDAMLTSWKEKRRYDLVRPTTLVQNSGISKVFSYAGAPSFSAKQIPAKEFQPYIRTMVSGGRAVGRGVISLIL